MPISDEAVGSKQALKEGNADPDPPLAQEFIELTVSGRVAELSAQAARTFASTVSSLSITRLGT